MPRQTRNSLLSLSLGLLACLVVAAVASARPDTDPAIATLHSHAGQLDVIRKGDRVPIAPRLPLHSGDVIHTRRGYATVRFGDGSLVRLLPSTRLEVSESATGRVVNVLVGRLWAFIARQKDRQVSFRSGGTIAAVRGTFVTMGVTRPLSESAAREMLEMIGLHEGSIEILISGMDAGAGKTVEAGPKGRAITTSGGSILSIEEFRQGLEHTFLDTLHGSEDGPDKLAAFMDTWDQSMDRMLATPGLSDRLRALAASAAPKSEQTRGSTFGGDRFGGDAQGLLDALGFPREIADNFGVMIQALATLDILQDFEKHFSKLGEHDRTAIEIELERVIGGGGHNPFDITDLVKDTDAAGPVPPPPVIPVSPTPTPEATPGATPRVGSRDVARAVRPSWSRSPAGRPCGVRSAKWA